MAGLQSENISANSTRLTEQSTSDKDICAFCLRRAVPSASDPHAPLFPFFSLVDCRHYACQPCALVHCDNAGRRILCPKCHCVSRLAQSGRRRTRSAAAAATDPDADRVSIDDGVSSTRSRRTGTSPTLRRSALKGKSGTSKRRASSVQFLANPTAFVVPGDGASDSAAAPAEDDGADEERRPRRASSPLTQDAVDALPLDPVEAQRRRVREQHLQLRAAEAAAKAEKAVSLYAITAAPPLPSTSVGSGAAANEGSKTKGRSRSQPVPKLPNTILEPKQEYPLPPPLELHTVDEAETHALSVPEDKRFDAESALPTAAATSSAAAAPEGNAEADSNALALASVSSPLIAPRRTEDEVQAATAGSDDKPQTTGALPPPSSLAEDLARPRQLLDDCESTEAEERGVVGDVEAHERAALKQHMEEEDTAIRARRGLVLEFESTPIPGPQPQPTPYHQHSHHHNAGSLSLGDLSDQVSVTSDDELSQRVSALKSVTSSTSTSRRRQHPFISSASEPPTQPLEKAADEPDATVAKGAQVVGASTPGGGISTMMRPVSKSGSVDRTLSPMTTSRRGQVSADEESEDYGEPVAAVAPPGSEDAKRLGAAREVEAAAAVAEVQAAAQEARAIAEEQERARRRQLQREAADEAAELKRKQQRQEEVEVRRRQLQEERAAFACQSLQDRESMAREALEKAEEVVREHYERSAGEWLGAALPLELEARRRARAAAEQLHQQEHEQAQLATQEGLQRDKMEEMEANSWSWLLSGARVDRVVAATEEGDRVQREYEALRFERLQLQLREDAADLIREEAHGRLSFVEYEAATRSLLQSHYAVQRQALAEDEQRQEAELLKKAAERREAAFRQRCQWEVDELDADEVSGRAMLREVEREERRTANLVFLQRLAWIRRKEFSQHTAPVDTVTAAEEAGMSSVLSDAPTVMTARMHGRVQPQQSITALPLALEEDEDGDGGDPDVTGAATPPKLRTPLITAKQLSELRAREAAYAAELQAALERLQEAERRVAEEAAIRAQAEQERQAVRAESERLIREAEQRAEQRIREARDAAEQLLQAQLTDLRDEAARRAEHASIIQALAEEEQRAVLEAKLQAAQRQLDEARQRAQEEVHRAREEAAELAAADAARAASEAQRREEEWQERCRAENLLRLAEREIEKEEAIRRLAEIEARAAEAVRLAREEAARTAAEAQERLADMEQRQRAREMEVQLAAQRVRSARDSLREFDSRSQSSRRTTPSRAEQPGQRPPTSSRCHEAPRLFAASSNHASQASAHTPLQTPPLAPSSSHTPSAVQPQPSAQSSALRAVAVAPAAVEAVPTVASDSTPPRVILSSQHTPLSSAVAPGPGRGGAAVPSSSASAAGATSLATMDPADIIRAAIRSAVQEIVEAQRRTQTLQDRAEQHISLSERRYHRHQGDRLRAARDVAAIESSYALSEAEESEGRHKRQQSWVHQARQRQPLRGGEHTTHAASSRISDGRLYSTRSSRGGYAQEVSDSPWTRSSSSPTSRLSPTRTPMPTASSPAAAAAPGSVSSNTLPSASSVYFDSMHRPSSVTFGAAHRFHGRYGSNYPVAPEHQKQQPPLSFRGYSAASRVLFAPRMAHEVRDAWASEEGEHGYAQGMPAAVQAHAYPPASSRQEQRNTTGAAQPPPRPLQQLPQHPRVAGAAAALPSAAHAYNEPEPRAPAAAAMDYSPPPRRSTTHTGAEVKPQQRRRQGGAGTNVGSGGGVGALPEPSRMCPRCYSTETTSPCWRCGEMICRRCGLPPGAARQLCCTAHHRAQLREFARRKAYEGGHATTAAAAGKVPSPTPHVQRQDQRLRGEHQVQTSFASSVGSVQIRDAAAFVDEPAARFDAGTSPLASPSPPRMIPSSAYRAPQQQQQRQVAYPQPNYPSVYPAFTVAGPAASSQQPMYSPEFQSITAAYPYAYSYLPPPPQQQQQFPCYVNSERPYTALSSLEPCAPPFNHPQSLAPSGYSVRAATAAVGSAATGTGGAGFAAGMTVSDAPRQEGAAAVEPEVWSAPGVPPSASRSMAVSAAAMPHISPAGLAQSAPPTAAVLPLHQAASEGVAPYDAQADVVVEATVPATAALDGTPDAQMQRQPPPSTRVDDSRIKVKAKRPAEVRSCTPPNAILAASVAGPAAESASLPGGLPEKQGSAAASVDALPIRDGVAAAAAATADDDGGDGTTAAAAALEEPKTERKKTFPAFFVSLCDGEGAVEPRRPKPPTPRNFVPSQLLPPTPARVPPPIKQRRRSALSGMLLIPQRRRGEQTAHRPHQQRKLSPLQAHEMNCPRSIRKSVSPSRSLSAQRRHRNACLSPYERAPNSSGARDVPKKSLPYPPSQRQHVNANGVAASLTKSIKSYIKSLSPVMVVDASGTPIFYEDVHKAESDGFCRAQQQRRPQERRATASPVPHDIYLRSGGIRGSVAEAEHSLPASRRHRSKLEGYYVDAPSQQQDSSQQQHQCSSRSASYYPYFTSSGATSETMPQPPHPQHQHRYAPLELHMPAHIPYTAPASDRRVPTLAELERRLQQLRLEDEYEAAEYHRREAPYAHRQQHVSALLYPIRAAAVGGNARTFVAAPSYGNREEAQLQQRRHNSATGRHPQLRTVSPPWRTDLNSSPVRPRWDISQPRSPIYHPAPATTAGG
ncbi:hypothetical protein LSCM1_06295 [Leishmania martiniquensis]|uniref:RING-type domain-containing protein n=1 Tax=Leishmania martiniquensis TaxID=1580590 RepID=A0A836KN75_9TRYP|nr:hypothetical protein LSCM1_06295 [Leishmania martiniquensis]